MRLIDADAFNEFISNHMDFLAPINTEKVTQSEIHKFINEQPTAYDVDKVVEKLEAYSNADEAERLGTMPVVELADAIKIVKGGGVNG